MGWNFSITQDDVYRFAEVSHDYNPLHLDASYARLTPFGEPIIHGILLVLKVLSGLTKGRRIRLTSLQVKFLKPAYLSQIFHVIEKKVPNAPSTRCLVEIRSLSTTLLTIEFDYVVEDFSTGTSHIVSGFSANKRAAMPMADSPSNLLLAATYSSNLPPVEFQSEQPYDCIPFDQLTVLLWSSYQVGMVCPGQQALFLDLYLDFTQIKIEKLFFLNNCEVKFNKRFSIYEFRDKCYARPTFQMRAISRPLPIRYRAENLLPILWDLPSFANKGIFITGASRGYGSVMALGFSLLGAHVFLNYKNDSSLSDAKALAEDVSRLGGKIELVKGDVEDRLEFSTISENFLKQRKVIDIFIHNAFPAIKSIEFHSQSSEQISSYVSGAISGFMNPYFALDSVMGAEADVILISSIFVEAPEKNFLHYITAKAALEGLVRTLKVEHPKRNFHNFRAPRMLTDQTNVGFSANNRSSAPLVFAEMIKRFYR